MEMRTLDLWLMRLYDLIDKFVPDAIPPGNIKALSRLNPDKIYLENVRSVLNISHRRAQSICDIAVKQGVFEGWIEIRCPDGSVPATAKTEASLPKMVRCWIEEDGESEPVYMETTGLSKVPFYRFTG